jgi:hypothetical protein
MVRTQQFKNLVTALKKGGFTYCHINTDNGQGYYAYLDNGRVGVRIFDGHVWDDGSQVFYALIKEYNKMGYSYIRMMPKAPDQLKALILEIKNATTQYPNH